MKLEVSQANWNLIIYFTLFLVTLNEVESSILGYFWNLVLQKDGI
jgi:hypothetical protein